ncbi:GIN domain-containing protein [Legionella sp. CNM-1927-20]|uniref:GIN domain-containing protein n=1 Tax=Legionella sp. CNM-1927-20 TaxID=3422221 RepID=UPI00403AA47E
MLRRSLILFFLILFLAGCTRTYVSAPKTILTVGKTTQTRVLPAFNDVIVHGRINVSLHTGYAKSKVILRGDPRDLAQINISSSNSRLFVSLLDAYPQHGPINIEIRTRHLNTFSYQGSGTINGQHLNSGLLDLFITNPGETRLGGNINLGRLEVHGPGYLSISGIKSSNLQLVVTGNPTIQLSGVVNLSNLDLRGDANISLYWVKSDWLTIRGRGHSTIQLAGIVNKLDLELWDYAHFKGRYLRAKRLFAKTHQRAVAELLAIKRQHTLATDASDIYFYEIPDMKTDFMAFDGAVLDMRDLNSPFVEEYTRYNK